MKLDEFLIFTAEKMKQAYERGDSVELVRLIDLTIATLLLLKRKYDPNRTP